MLEVRIEAVGISMLALNVWGTPIAARKNADFANSLSEVSEGLASAAECG